MGPVRRPLVRKFHLMMNDALPSAMSDVLAPALASLGELELMLDSMVRELTRLQAQVEVLQQMLDEQSAEMPVAQLGTIGEADDGDPYAAGSGQCALAVGFDTHWNRKSG